MYSVECVRKRGEIEARLFWWALIRRNQVNLVGDNVLYQWLETMQTIRCESGIKGLNLVSSTGET